MIVNLVLFFGIFGMLSIVAMFGARYGSYRIEEKARLFNEKMKKKAKIARDKADLMAEKARQAQDADAVELTLIKAGIDGPGACSPRVYEEMKKLGRTLEITQKMNEVEADAKAAMSVAANTEIKRVSVENTSYYDSYGVTITMNVKGKKEFKPVMAAIRKTGYRRINMKENVDAKQITWTYRRPEHDGKKYMRLFLKVNFPGEDEPQASCRYVQVGTRTIEEPIMELVCDEVEENR